MTSITLTANVSTVLASDVSRRKEWKVVLVDSSGNRFLLIFSHQQGEDVQFKVGEPLTVRGIMHTQYGRETMPVLLPAQSCGGFVRYKGRVLIPSAG